MNFYSYNAIVLENEQLHNKINVMEGIIKDQTLGSKKNTQDLQGEMLKHKKTKKTWKKFKN